MAQFSARAWVFLLSIGLSAAFLDQWTKYLAVAHLTVPRGEESGWQRFVEADHPRAARGIVVVENYWNHVYAENPGAAWSFMADANEGFRKVFFIVMILVVGSFVVVSYFRTPREQIVQRVAWSVLAGGALGNFIDRLHQGYVIDFIQWHYKDKFYWPVFNIADVAIFIGIALLLLSSMRQDMQSARKR